MARQVGHDFGYSPPRHNVILLSCMDGRLIDEVAALMERDNLTHRYDHVVLAGAALGVMQEVFPAWRETFFQHLRLAIDLHAVKDVYIVEHRNCGAYAQVLKQDYGDTPEEQDREEHDHAEQAYRLRDLIQDWCAGQVDNNGKPIVLGIRCFMIDLRGEAKILADTRPAQTV